MFPDFGVLGKWGSRDDSGEGELEKMVKFGHKELDNKGISRNGNDVTSESMVYQLPTAV